MHSFNTLIRATIQSAMFPIRSNDACKWWWCWNRTKPIRSPSWADWKKKN